MPDTFGFGSNEFVNKKLRIRSTWKSEEGKKTKTMRADSTHVRCCSHMCEYVSEAKIVARRLNRKFPHSILFWLLFQFQLTLSFGMLSECVVHIYIYQNALSCWAVVVAFVVSSLYWHRTVTTYGTMATLHSTKQALTTDLGATCV